MVGRCVAWKSALSKRLQPLILAILKRLHFFSAFEGSIEKNGLFKVEPVLEVVLEVKADRTLHICQPHRFAIYLVKVTVFGYLAHPIDLFTASCQPFNNSVLLSSAMLASKFFDIAQFLATSSLSFQ